MDRFFNSAGLMRIEVPETKEELKQLIQELTNKVTPAMCSSTGS